MFDIGWTELLLIGIVALIVVGPKDLPVMFHTLGRFTAKARGISETEVVRDVMLKAQATKKFVEYDELVGLLLYLVSDAGASCTGATFPIDGGWTAS